jgi:photosystem II stability/assembly factor-like uncharacterized protein
MAGTSCGLFGSTGLSSNWILNTALSIENYTVIGDSLFISVPYNFSVGSDFGIKRLDLSNPDVPAVDLNPMNDVKALAHSGSVLFAGSLSLGFLTSTDHGITWNQDNEGLYSNMLNQKSVHAIEVTDTYIYAGTEFGVFRNTLALDHWELIKSADLFWDRAVIKEIDGILYLAIGKELYFSYNQGTELNLLYTAPSAITSLIGNNLQLFITTASDGILRTQNGGIDWDEINTGLTDLHVNTISYFDTTLVCGTQSDGLFSSQGNQWINSSDGLVCSSISSIATTSAGLVTNDRDKVYYSNNGINWSDISPNVFKDFFMSIVTMGDSIFLSVNHDTLAIPSNLNFIVYSPDNGVTWMDPVNPVPEVRGNGFSLRCSAGKLFAYDSDIMYATDNAGLTWTDMRQTAYPFNFFSSLVIYNSIPFACIDAPEAGLMRYDENTGWILSNSGFQEVEFLNNLCTFNDGILVMSSDRSVYVSTDNGSQWTRTNNGSGVNFSRIEDFVASGTSLYAATDKGVYCTNDMGNSWNPINFGLKNIHTTSIEIFADTLYVGTKGNGIWKLALSKVNLGIPPVKELCTSVTISPNPAFDKITLTNMPAESLNYSIYDMSGKLIMTGNVMNGQSINTVSLETGAYMLMIKDSGNYLSRNKVIISK